jgi:putative DNA primase/helicase
MVELASSVPLLVVRANQLDEKRSLLGVQNGAIDLSDGSLKAPTQRDYITMLASIVYDPAAACPVFGKFLDRIMGGDAELIAYLQRVIGYSLSGYTSEQCLFFLYGAGANGKSTLLNLLRDLLGPSYCKYTPTETITVRPGKTGATPELARLPGARTVMTNEIEDNSWLAESLIKQMTGGDPLTARNLYQDYFEFVPQFKLFIAGNHKPIIRGDDIGIWRRIHLIPFLVTIPQEERDS